MYFCVGNISTLVAEQLVITSWCNGPLRKVNVWNYSIARTATSFVAFISYVHFMHHLQCCWLNADCIKKVCAQSARQILVIVCKVNPFVYNYSTI